MTSVILLKFSKKNSLPLTLFQFDILFILIFNQRSRLRSKSYEDRFLRYDYFSPTKLIIKKKARNDYNDALHHRLGGNANLTLQQLVNNLSLRSGEEKEISEGIFIITIPCRNNFSLGNERAGNDSNGTLRFVSKKFRSLIRYCTGTVLMTNPRKVARLLNLQELWKCGAVQ